MPSSSITLRLRPAAESAPVAPEGRIARPLAVVALCAMAAWSAVAAPLVFVGALLVAAATAVFVAAPFFALAAIVLVRPSLDSSGEILTVAGANLAGITGVLIVVAGGLAAVLIRAWPRTSFTTVYASLVALALVSLLWSAQPDDGVRAWFGLAAPFVVFLIASSCVRDRRRFERLVQFVLASAALPLAVGFVQLATGDVVVKQGFASVQATFTHPNGYGMYLLVIVTLALVARLESRERATRIVTTAVLTLAAVSLCLTWARFAWLAVLAVLLMLAILEYRRLVPLALVLGFVGAVVAPAAVSALGDRFDDLRTSYGTSSVEWRLENWGRMLPVGGDRAATGHGLGSYLLLSNREFGIYDYQFQDPDSGRAAGDVDVYAHNDYVHFFVELGVLGALLWFLGLATLATMLFRLRRLPWLRPYALALTGIVLALIVVGVSENVNAHNGVLMLVFGLAGAMLGASRGERRDGRGVSAAR